MSRLPNDWGSWMVPQITITGQFELHCRKEEAKRMSRTQLENEVTRLIEWDFLRKAQINSALKVITEMQAKIATLQTPDADPLKRWLDMVASMEKPSLVGEG